MINQAPLLRTLLPLLVTLFTLPTTTQSTGKKAAKQILVRNFKYPVAPSLMNFRTSYTNYMSQYPYWSNFENYFQGNNTVTDMNLKISDSLKPRTKLVLKQYLTHYRITQEEKPYKIRVKLVNSQVSKFFICTKQGEQPVNIDRQKNGYFVFDAHDCDFGGQTKDQYGLEKWFSVDKLFNDTGWLSIYSFDFELDGHKEIPIKAEIELSGNFYSKIAFFNPTLVIEHSKKQLDSECPFPCQFGGCLAGECDCDESYFGRICDQNILSMKGDVLRIHRELEKYDFLHFQEYLQIGHHDIHIQLVSEEKPRMLILGTESRIQDYKHFMEVSPDLIKQRKATIIPVVELMTKGRAKKVLVIENKWVYLSFVTFDRCKLDIRISRKRGHYLAFRFYLLYIVILILVIMVFVIVLCVACTSKRHQHNDRMNHDEFMDDGSSESSENKMTLEPADYDVWMPKISYKKMIANKSKMYHKECTICYDDLSSNVIRKVLVCGHIFHDECLIKWLRERETCPNCKHSLTKSTMEEQKEELLEMSRMEKSIHGAERKVSSGEEEKQQDKSPDLSEAPSQILKNLDKSDERSASIQKNFMNLKSNQDMPHIQINGLNVIDISHADDESLSPIIPPRSSNSSMDQKPSIEELNAEEIHDFEKTLEQLDKVNTVQSRLPKLTLKSRHNQDEEDYFSSRQNLNMMGKIQVLKINRSPEPNPSPSRISPNKKVHFFMESNYSNQLSPEKRVNKSKIVKKKTQSTGEEEGAQRLRHEEVIVTKGLKKNSRKGVARGETLPGTFMNKKIIDDTFENNRKNRMSLNKLDTLQSGKSGADQLSKPSNFSMYKKQTLRSKPSESYLPEVDEIVVPRLRTNTMQENGSVSGGLPSIPKSKGSSGFKFNSQMTRSGSKTQSVPRISSFKHFRFGEANKFKNIEKLNTLGPNINQEVIQEEEKF